MNRKVCFIILTCLAFLFCLGCEKKEPSVEIHSNIVEESSYVVGIHYPTIGYRSFDKAVESFIQSTYRDFLENEAKQVSPNGKAELNIDYQLSFVNDRYANLVLTVFINSPYLAHPINQIQTFVYDMEKRHMMTLSDLIDPNVFADKIGIIQTSFLENYKECILLDSFRSVVTPDMKNYPFFTFTDSDFTIYFNPYTITAGYCNIISTTFSFSHIPPKIALEKEEHVMEQVTFSPVVRTLSPEGKIVSLTFDDGPSKYTDDILTILEQNQSVGTFFVLGNKVENHKEVLRRLLQLGNEIGNHTYNHRSMYQLSTEELLRQIDMTQQLIYETTGYTPKYFRPTYGTVTRRARKSVTLEISLWDIDTKDWKSNKSAQTVLQETMEDVEDGSVILLHDTHKKTVDAVKLLVPELKKQGYQIVTLSERDEILKLRENLNLTNKN